MNTLLIARSIKSVFAITPGRRSGSVELNDDRVKLGGAQSEQEAIRGDFFVVGNDMRRAVTKHVQNAKISQQQQVVRPRR